MLYLLPCRYTWSIFSACSLETNACCSCDHNLKWTKTLKPQRNLTNELKDTKTICRSVSSCSWFLVSCGFVLLSVAAVICHRGDMITAALIVVEDQLGTYERRVQTCVTVAARGKAERAFHFCDAPMNHLLFYFKQMFVWQNSEMLEKVCLWYN